MSSRRRSTGKFAAPVVKSTPKASKTTIDESRAAVSATDSLQAALRANNDAIEISSDEDSDEDVSDEEMGAPDAEAGDAKETVNGKDDEAENPTQPKAEAEAAEDEEEAGSPTFGELLRGTIDVPAILSQQGDSSKAVASQSSRKNLAPPSLSSLSTVLTQALKTEDTDLLESCLQVTNLETIQQTIERLDSSLAGILLTKLAARFHRRPGRAGSLMTWVKWTLVAHGGALAVQPKVLERLVSLQKVLNERSRGLPSLLALKGKLDMLDAQMQLRQGRRRRGAGQTDDAEEDDEEEGAIYVEGEEDAEADADTANGLGSRKALLAAGDDDDDDEVPAANGFIDDSDDEDDDEDAVAAEDESSGEEVVDEDEVDHDDVEDSDDDDDSDAEAAPPAKVQKTASSFAKRK
ncbi:NUC189-domain-containing protein [Colletotrichum eremochloae]|nr:NUC189-domain-containing protein [Colletotrichum eremochloae]